MKAKILFSLPSLLLFLPVLAHAGRQKGELDGYEEGKEVARGVVPQHGDRFVLDPKCGLYYCKGQGKSVAADKKFEGGKLYL